MTRIRILLVATAVVGVFALAFLPLIAPGAMGWLGMIFGFALIGTAPLAVLLLVRPPGGGSP